MSLWHLMLTSALQSPLRFALSALSVAAAVAGLTLVRTVDDVWRNAIDSAAEDRLIVRSALASGEPLPLAYVDEAKKAEPEIRNVTLRWTVDVAATGARARRMVVTSRAGKTENNDALSANPRVLRAFGLMPGQSVKITSRNGKSEERRVASVSGKEGENGLAAIAEGFASDSADELVVDVSNGGIAPEVAKRIDSLFAEKKVPTVTQSARDATRELERSLQDVFRFIDVLSAAILIVIAFVVALTIAFATRERTTDYAVLRALGFSPSHVVTIVATEALFVCAVGSVVGAIIAAVGAFALGSVLADAMPELVPSYGFSPTALLLSIVAACAICVLAAIIPALAAARVEAAVALRTQE